MIKKFILIPVEAFVRATKNKNFRFDDELSLGSLIGLTFNQLILRLRGKKLFFRGRLVNGLQLGFRVTIRNFAKISIGRNVKLDDYVLLDGLGTEGLSIGDNCSIGAYSKLVVSTSYNNLGKGITLGSNIGIGEFAYIGGAGGLKIGNETIVGQYLSIHPENHNFEDINVPIRHQGVSRVGVLIGKNVWIGSKVTILDGVKIGDGSIVAAGSVVTAGEYKKNSIIAGNPAKLISIRS